MKKAMPHVLDLLLRSLPSGVTEADFQACEPYRELIRELAGVTPELAQRNSEKFRESMKRLEAK